MLQSIWNHIEQGINHVLDINAYSHILFLIVLTLPYAFKDWKRVLWLITIITIGFALTLILAIFNVIHIKTSVLRFLIPIIILIVAVFNVFTAGKGPNKGKLGVLFFSALFFGLIHGLGSASEFKALKGSNNTFIYLLEFALGIEIGQIIVVFIVLFLGYLAQTLFRFSKRDWVMVASAFVVGLVLPLILKNNYLF